MKLSSSTRLVARCIVAIGIVLSMLFAGAAPLEHTRPCAMQVAP